MLTVMADMYIIKKDHSYNRSKKIEDIKILKHDIINPSRYYFIITYFNINHLLVVINFLILSTYN